ncbi:MAG: RNA methyltransferase [Sphingobacteriales bacterium]|nr:RNA methyltransferase [Sphingobacteriales bacterium]
MQLPESLLRSLQNVPGFNKEAFEKVHTSGEQITSIRLNPAKADEQHLSFSLLSKVPWSEKGFYLEQRPSFTLDPLFHGGAYYVQEASSMFLEEALKQSVDLAQPIKILDLCAAPGGKSTLIQSLISERSLLVSNEVIKTRVTILSENITKWGAANVVVTNNDPKDFRRLEAYFDVIVVDAPCSGSGLFRKDPDAINEWSEQNVQLCHQRQQRILADVLPALKEGGTIIYSTCSYSKDEDEEICDWLVNDCHLTSVKYFLEPDWNIIETVSEQHKAYGYRFYPDKVKGEGFFIAAFKKGQMLNAGLFNERKNNKQRGKLEKASVKEIDVLRQWLKNANDFSFIKLKDEVLALPAYFENELVELQTALYIKKAGIKLGTIIRDELIPDHELAISKIIIESIATVAVDKETALQYLRREEIRLDAPVKGWNLLTYNQLPLGWVKLLPNRVNNYYPKEWRILHK